MVTDLFYFAATVATNFSDIVAANFSVIVAADLPDIMADISSVNV